MATLQSTLKLTLLDQVSARARGITTALNGLQRQTRLPCRLPPPLLAPANVWPAVVEAALREYADGVPIIDERQVMRDEVREMVG